MVLPLLFFRLVGIDGSDGKISIFAPISHSESGNSGIFDAGPDGLAQFKGSHACNPFCAQFGLAPF
ncbi:hypothetical protein C8R46DRAFT_1128735 [Mycena filopes]|nr:hypothetical protein C8R46DRAFT_1128735 [Mycena filopes]